jgi:uncharacterized protein (TIRG00374 family)
MTTEPKQTTPPASSVLSGRSHLLSWLFVLGLVAFFLLFLFSDARELWRTASSLDVRLLILPLGCAIASYAIMALSYQGIAQAAGSRVPFWEMLKVTFVANAVNYLVTTGGLSGFAVRMYFFIRMGIPSGTAVTISLVQTIVTNMVLLLFVVTGFFYLLRTHDLHGFAFGATTLMLGIFVLAALLSVLLLVHRQLRRRTLFLLAEGVHSVMRRFFPRHKPRRVHIWRFQRNLNRGLEFLLARKRHMVLPTLWIVLDWFVTLMILHTAFVAVRYPIPMSFVVVGFAVGITLSLVSFIPGGLGVMEGSMAAIFSSLGVPFETAVVAVLVFRVAYYLLPLVISVFFFRGMLVQGTHVPPDLFEPPI